MVFFDGGRIHHHFFDIAGIGQFEHGVDEGLLQNRAQTAGPCFTGQGLFGNGLQGFWANLEFNAFHVEQLAKLFDQGIFGFGQDLNQCLFGQLGQGGDHRHASHQLGDQTEFDQIFRLDFGEDFRE